MILLDCESIDSIYSSLEAIVGAKRSAIESFLDSMDLDAIYNSSSAPWYPPEKFLLEAFSKTFRSNLSYDATCWFHLTRVAENTDFEAGILPLGQQLDSIWDFLYGLLQGVIPEKTWNAFRQGKLQSAHNLAHLYAIKAENPFHWGPYAMLVRDIAFKSKEVGNHDCLLGPEIVEDICVCFEHIYHIDVLKIFREETKPCIVNFIDHNASAIWIRTALWHLRKLIRLEPCHDYCNGNFDGRGVAIAQIGS